MLLSEWTFPFLPRLLAPVFTGRLLGVAHWCGLIYAFTKSLTFDVHSFRMALIWIEMLAFCLVLMWKRRSSERLVRLLDEQMPRKNLLATGIFDQVVTLFALLPIVEQAVVHRSLVLRHSRGPVAQSGKVSTQLDALRHRKRNLLDLRVHRIPRPRSHLFPHLLTFLLMYLVKNTYLDQASEYKTTFFKVSVSAEALQLRRWLHWV